MPQRVPRYLRRNPVVLALLLSAAVNTALVVIVVILNSHRIDDIQRSRVTSCRQTYEATRQVFRPFFRTKSLRTAKEQRDIDKFNRTVDHLIAGCGAQTRPRKEQP